MVVYTYNTETDTYYMSFSSFKTWLPTQNANTVNTPYKVVLSEIQDTDLTDATTNGTLGDTLIQNSTKYVELQFSSDFSVATIGSGAFQTCNNLISINIPDTVTKIDHGAFWQCSNLKEVTLSPYITYIGNSAFYQCNSLEAIILPSVLSSTGTNVFEQCTELKEVIIPSALTAINDKCFFNCSHLTKVTILNSNIVLRKQVFQNCVRLETLIIVGANSVTKLNNNSSSVSSHSLYTNGSKTLCIYVGSTATTLASSMTNYKEKLFGTTTPSVRIYDSEKPCIIEAPSSYSFDNNIVTVDYADYEQFLAYNYANNIHSNSINSPLKLCFQNIGARFSPVKVGLNYATSLGYSSQIRYYDCDNNVTLEYDFSNSFCYVDLSASEISSPSIMCDNNAYIIVTPNLTESVSNIDYAFKDCINLSTVFNIPNSISSMKETFAGCTNLKNIAPIPKRSIAAWRTFKDCTSLTNLPNSMYNGNFQGFIQGCTALFNGGIINNISVYEYAINSGIKAVGVLRNSVDSDIFSGLTNIKIYTTSEYFDDLTDSVAQNYPNSNFEVIEVDACLDYDELEDWLEAQPQNTVETPYKIFIGGGLSADKLQGTEGIYYTRPTASPLGTIINRCGKYVDFSELCLPSDCTTLRCSFQNTQWRDYTGISSKVIHFCEIPSQVESLYKTFYNNEYFKGFANGNVIPNTVITLDNVFSSSDSIDDLHIEHQITNGYSYNLGSYNSKIFAKDYTYFSNNYPLLHSNHKIILECDYSDLDTYLGWFRNSCDGVNLKVNGLSYADLRDWSATQGSPLSRKLLGENISDSTVQNYVNSSTFDLRLTEAPDNLGTLYYCFFNGNVKYSFDIPYTVQVMVGAYYGCKLVEAPVLSERTSDMSQAFLGTLITEAPIIPNSVTDISYAFQDTNISEMPDLPNNRLTNINGAFRNTNITRAKRIPSTVTNMYMCFYECSSLIEVENVPSSVTNLEHCFEKCSSLEAINGWEVDTRNATMTSCFYNCTSLTEINTTTKKTVDYDKWVHITVKTDTTDNTKYNLTLRTLATETQQAQTLTIQVDKAVIYSFLTDEILFSPNGTLSDSYITDMLNYKYPFGGGLDPSRKNFVLWAAQNSNVITNIGGGGGSGTVKSVNNILPDANGDVTITNITGSSGSCTGNAETATTAKTARRIGTTPGSAVGSIWIS